MNENNNKYSKTPLESSIDQFLSFFEEKINDLQKIRTGKSRILFQKILYVGLLDALSKTVASSKKGNRERLVSLIRIFSGWDKCDRISLPHLVRMLEKVPDPEFSKLREYAFSLFDTWSPGTLFYLDKDPTLNDIKKLWPLNLPKPLENINLESFQHANLFYLYRSSLVHEIREPGYGMDFGRSDEPYYHSMQTVEDLKSRSENCTWELVYPIDFYRKLCRNTIRELHKYYIKNRIDPYSSFTFGSYWIEALNV
jgi:hypothetical protein